MEPGSCTVALLGRAVMRMPSRATAAMLIALVVASAIHWWPHHDRHTYLTGNTAEFVAIFPAPPPRDSYIERRELDELLELQDERTKTEVAAARKDRKTDIERF